MRNFFAGLALVFLLFLTHGEVRAMNTGFTMSRLACSGTNWGCTQAEAMEACQLQVAFDLGAGTIGDSWCETTTSPTLRYVQMTVPAANPNAAPSRAKNSIWTTGACTGSTNTRDTKPPYGCVNAQDRCLNKNDNVQSTMIATAGQCIDGCAYGGTDPQPGKSGKVSSTGGAVLYGNIGFTGATCTTAAASKPPPEKPYVCIQNPDALTVCTMPSGRQCYSTGQGNINICWNPSETGTKQNEGVTQKRDGGTTKPPTPDGKTDTNKPTTTTTTTTNNTTITTTTNNYNNTNNTNDPGVPDSGGNPGEDGGDDEEGDDTNPGTANPGMGSAYAPDGSKTVDSVIDGYKARMSNAPIVNAAASFFVVNITGSCPVWTMPETAFTPSMTLDVQCTSEFQNIWNSAAFIVLAIAAFCAFRIAIY